MAYGLDLRQKVIDYIENGGRVTKAAQVFGIGRASIYRWLSRKELEATKVKYRQRSLDRKELLKDIQENPETRLKQRAEFFGVSTTAIFKAIKKMKITRKKKNYVIGKEVEKKG
jgi:putative transposase